MISTKKNVHLRLPSICLLLTITKTYQKLLNTRSQVVCYIDNKNVVMPLEILESSKCKQNSFGCDLGTHASMSFVRSSVSYYVSHKRPIITSCTYLLFISF